MFYVSIRRTDSIVQCVQVSTNGNRFRRIFCILAQLMNKFTFFYSSTILFKPNSCSIILGSPFYSAKTFFIITNIFDCIFVGINECCSIFDSCRIFLQGINFTNKATGTSSISSVQNTINFTNGITVIRDSLLVGCDGIVVFCIFGSTSLLFCKVILIQLVCNSSNIVIDCLETIGYVLIYLLNNCILCFIGTNTGCRFFGQGAVQVGYVFTNGIISFNNSTILYRCVGLADVIGCCLIFQIFLYVGNPGIQLRIGIRTGSCFISNGLFVGRNGASILSDVVFVGRNIFSILSCI